MANKRHKIVIKYEPQPPDPPDERCIICGAPVLGWVASLYEKDGMPCLCWNCESPPGMAGGFPNFRIRKGGFRSWSLRTSRVYGAAGAILWMMEKEIEQRKRN